MRVSYSTLVKTKRAGRATSVRVSPTGTAVTGYQVPLGNRHSLKEAGVIGLPSWSEKATQTETWVKVPRLSTTCPRRVVAFDGGKGNIDKTMEFGDEFDGTVLNAVKWTTTGSPTISVSEGYLDLTAGISSNRYISAGAFGDGYAVRYRSAPPILNGSYGRCPIGFGIYTSPISTSATTVAIYSVASGTVMLATQNGSAVTYSTVATDSAWVYTVDEIRRLSTGSTWVRNGTTVGTNTTNLPSGAVPVVIGSGYANASVYNRSSVDHIAVRKYTANEPLAGTAQPSTTNRALSRPMSHADLIRACCT